MKIDFCDVCLSTGKLSKTTRKGQTILKNRLSLCSSSKCSKTWKEINNNKFEVTRLLNKAEKQARDLS